MKLELSESVSLSVSYWQGLKPETLPCVKIRHVRELYIKVFLDAVASLVLTFVSNRRAGLLTHQNSRPLIGCHIHAHAASDRHLALFTD